MGTVALLLAAAVLPFQPPPGQIAFMREGRVWVIGADGTGERPLTGALLYKVERPVTWTADGRRVLFWNHSEIGWDVWTVPADGGDATNLTRVQSGGCRCPACSPDGKLIAFMRDEPEGLYVMDADGAHPRRLTEKAFRDDAPSWSPDGKRLAYSVMEGNASYVHTYEFASGQAVRLVRGMTPSWSPDGRRLLFVGSRGGSPALLLAAPDGKDEMRLTSGPGAASDPAWSPNGSRIAYFRSQGGKAELRVVSVDGRSDTALASIEGRWLSAPSWSPDGQWLAFAAGPQEKQAAYVVDAQGRAVRPLAGGGACYPVWRPAGPKEKNKS
jgi:TolB protein